MPAKEIGTPINLLKSLDETVVGFKTDDGTQRHLAHYEVDPTTGSVVGLVGPDGGLVQFSNRSARPKLLVFGNSLCSISNTGLSASTTTLTAIAYPGATSVQVASISGLVSGDKLGIGLYDGTVHETTISGAPSGNTVNISSALSRMARLGAGVQKYTTVALGNIRQIGRAHV